MGIARGSGTCSEVSHRIIIYGLRHLRFESVASRNLLIPGAVVPKARWI